MREFKFRCYDEESKSMEYEIAVGKGYGKDSYILFLGLGETFAIEDKLKIMQYTGLKDKNRVEIYEGDILKFKYTSSDYKKAYIEWNEEKASYDFVSNEIKLNYSYNFRQINNIEVIGNIYENKDKL